jgi:hypothetical protein
MRQMAKCRRYSRWLLAWMLASAACGATVPAFEDVSAKVGIDFRHQSGPSLFFNPEAIGPGLALLDFDQDGLVDVFLVNGAEVAENGTVTVRHPDRLYRNTGGGRFEDVTDCAGIVGEGIGQGVTVCDVDNDGDPDLYLSGYRENLLYINNGDGTFVNRTRESQVFNQRFAASSAFGDYDRDGFVDLYIGNYLSFGYNVSEQPKIIRGPRGVNVIDTLGPSIYFGAANHLYHNTGDGTFYDATVECNVGNNARGQSKAMGVVFADLDNDGWSDILITNDQLPVTYFRNLQDTTFKDVARQRYIADARGNMGIAIGDYDGDGAMDVYITHFVMEHNELYHATAGGRAYEAQGDNAGLLVNDRHRVGWGCSFLDYDADGRVDLVVANGNLFSTDLPRHVPLPHRNTPEPQPVGLYRNRDGRVFDVAEDAILPRSPVMVGRGLAVGDLDSDGLPDVALAANNGSPAFLRNRVEAPGRSLWVLPVGTASNRSGVGTRIECGVDLGSGPVKVSREVMAGNGYLSSDAPFVHLGLGKSPVSSLQVRWPSGLRETHTIPPTARVIRLVEGLGNPE